MPTEVLSSSPVSSYPDRLVDPYPTIDSAPSSYRKPSPRRGVTPLPSPSSPEPPALPLIATRFVPVRIEQEPIIEEVKLTSGAQSGADALAITIRLVCDDDQLLWDAFHESKDRLMSLLAKRVELTFGRQFQIAEVHYERGSLILTIYVTVKAWVLLHKGLFAVIGFLTGAYLPLKELVKDVSGWMPRLKQLLLGFFRQEPPPLIGV